MAFWWVNQGRSYDAARREGSLWAPLAAVGGRRVPSWETMGELQPGDRVLHYARQQVLGISTVASSAAPADCPAGLQPYYPHAPGLLARTHYVDASRPVHRDEIPKEWRLDEPPEGPFNQRGAVKLGYLFPLTPRFYSGFTTRFQGRY